MLLRLRYCCRLSSRGIYDMRHWLPKDGIQIVTFKNMRAYQRELYSQINVPVAFIQEGNPSTGVCGPAYLQQIVDTQFWAKDIDFSGPSADTLLIKVTADNIARGNYIHLNLEMVFFTILNHPKHASASFQFLNGIYVIKENHKNVDQFMSLSDAQWASAERTGIYTADHGHLKVKVSAKSCRGIIQVSYGPCLEVR